MSFIMVLYDEVIPDIRALVLNNGFDRDARKIYSRQLSTERLWLCTKPPKAL